MTSQTKSLTETCLREAEERLPCLGFTSPRSSANRSERWGHDLGLVAARAIPCKLFTSGLNRFISLELDKDLYIAMYRINTLGVYMSRAVYCPLKGRRDGKEALERTTFPV